MLMPPPPPRGGAGRWVIIIILLLILSVSIIFNFILLGASAGGASMNIRQTTIVPGDIQNKIAVVPIEGIIQDGDPAVFGQILGQIEKDAAVKALVVEIDTPGGSASASEEMYHRLNRFRQTTRDQGKQIPIVVAMRGMATSGGYYVACGGDYIFAEPGTLTGNIGVLFPRVNVSELMNKYGVKEDTLTATTTGHSYKNAGSMMQPDNPVDEAYLQNLIDQIFAQFKAVVQTGRKGKLKDPAGDVFSGKAFIAQDAKDRGLIDQIDYPEKAYDYAATAAGVSNKTVVRYSPAPPLWMQVLGAHWTLGGGRSRGQGTIMVNGVGIDADSVAQLITARPLMLWRSN
jgi:protease-4